MKKDNLVISDGFTLMELLIAIAIVAVLASLVALRFIGPQASARDTRRQADLKQYQNALEVYATKNNGTYPIRTSSVSPSSLCSILGVSACPQDPQVNSGHTDYRYQTNSSGLNYVLWTELEKTKDNFVLCSNGQAGIKARSGFFVSGGNCPL